MKKAIAIAAFIAIALVSVNVMAQEPVIPQPVLPHECAQYHILGSIYDIIPRTFPDLKERYQPHLHLEAI